MDTGDEDERAIWELEKLSMEAVTAKDLDGFVSLYADDASLFGANTPVIAGKDMIRESWKSLFAQPGFSMSTQIVNVEASHIRDLAYAYGNYTITLNDEYGNAFADKGKYIQVLSKQPVGAWKVIIESANSDLPLLEDLTKQSARPAPCVSPDGKWIVSISSDSGKPEISMRPFPKNTLLSWLFKSFKKCRASDNANAVATGN
ncbi:MAG: SgcJ/EcaC family oxidoreductase [Acidobacteriota bacterium]